MQRPIQRCRMGRLINLNGDVAQVLPHNGCDFTTEEIAVMIGAGFHIIETNVGTCMAVSNRLPKGEDLNRTASFLAGTRVIGPALLLRRGEWRGPATVLRTC